MRIFTSNLENEIKNLLVKAKENFVQNNLGIMTRQQKLARISMATTRLSDVFKLIDYGAPTKNFN
jgi:hypothetical protein